MADPILMVRNRVLGFIQDANELLAKHETSMSRVISVDETRKKLSDLSLQQDELFCQALLCIKRDLYRPAHVLAWAAFIDFLETKLASDNLVRVKAERPKWTNCKSIEDLRENVSEYQLIEVARDLGLLRKSEMKTIHGLLSKRNECAHPSGYRPGLNESLGFVSELLSRIGQLKDRTL